MKLEVFIHTPTKSVSINFTQNNDPCTSHFMVTGVLHDYNNQPKRAKIKTQSQPASEERPIVARTLPMPKTPTASLLTFDGKTGNFELFQDLFRNNNKIYPNLTEVHKIFYFHPLLSGDALQPFCNIEDSKTIP